MSINPKFTVFLTAYIECALWSTTDNSDESGGDPLDNNYSPDDLHFKTFEQMERDCREFWTEHKAVLSRDPGRGGYDFWLTRCDHGAGFWDGHWSDENGKRLTDASRAYGNVDLYVGDDGKIYSS